MQAEKGYDQTEDVNCKNAEGINNGCHAENHNRQDPFIMESPLPNRAMNSR